MTLKAQQILSPLPFPIQLPDEAPSKFIADSIQDWTDTLRPEAVQKITDIIVDIRRGEEAAVKGATNHRWRRLSHFPGHHVAIGFDEYTEPGQATLKAGFTISLDNYGIANLCHNAPKQSDGFCFHAKAIQAATRRIGWLDQELIHFLEHGFAEYPSSTPPLS